MVYIRNRHNLRVDTPPKKKYNSWKRRNLNLAAPPWSRASLHVNKTPSAAWLLPRNMGLTRSKNNRSRGRHPMFPPTTARRDLGRETATARSRVKNTARSTLMSAQASRDTAAQLKAARRPPRRHSRNRKEVIWALPAAGRRRSVNHTARQAPINARAFARGKPRKRPENVNTNSRKETWKVNGK